MTCLFEFIESSLIINETCPWVWLKIFCGMYPNRTYRFSSPAGLWRFVTRGAVGCQTCLLQLEGFLYLKYNSSSSFKPSFIDCWLVCIIFTGSEFIDPETCTGMWLKIVSGTYPNQTYGFSSPAGLWKVVTRVPVFMVSPVVMNTLIGFKAVLQVWFFCGLLEIYL